MLRLLFPRLTAARGEALFAALVAEARRPHWFTEGQIPDSLDGRFAVLATVLALATVRLERGGEQAHQASVALAERFVEAMDAEHRELGVSDPGLGKQVRKLVAALGRRVEAWRRAVDGEAEWDGTVAASLYRGNAAAPGIATTGEQLRALWRRLDAMGDSELAAGRIG